MVVKEFDVPVTRHAFSEAHALLFGNYARSAHAVMIFPDVVLILSGKKHFYFENAL